MGDGSLITFAYSYFVGLPVRESVRQDESDPVAFVQGLFGGITLSPKSSSDGSISFSDELENVVAVIDEYGNVYADMGGEVVVFTPVVKNEDVCDANAFPELTEGVSVAERPADPVQPKKAPPPPDVEVCEITDTYFLGGEQSIPNEDDQARQLEKAAKNTFGRIGEFVGDLAERAGEIIDDIVPDDKDTPDPIKELKSIVDKCLDEIEKSAKKENDKKEVVKSKANPEDYEFHVDRDGVDEPQVSNLAEDVPLPETDSEASDEFAEFAADEGEGEGFVVNAGTEIGADEAEISSGDVRSKGSAAVSCEPTDSDVQYSKTADHPIADETMARGAMSSGDVAVDRERADSPRTKGPLALNGELGGIVFAAADDLKREPPDLSFSPIVKNPDAVSSVFDSEKVAFGPTDELAALPSDAEVREIDRNGRRDADEGDERVDGGSIVRNMVRSLLPSGDKNVQITYSVGENPLVNAELTKGFGGVPPTHIFSSALNGVVLAMGGDTGPRVAVEAPAHQGNPSDHAGDEKEKNRDGDREDPEEEEGVSGIA